MSLKRIFQAVFWLPVCLSLYSPWLAAQSQDSAPQSAPAQDQPAQDQQEPGNDQPLETFKSQVNVVNLFFNVKDKHGMLIPNLTKD